MGSMGGYSRVTLYPFAFALYVEYSNLMFINIAKGTRIFCASNERQMAANSG